MKDIVWTVIRYHRRKKHIFGLGIILILALSVGPLLGDLSLGEQSYVMQQWTSSSIEIIGVLFAVYFAATAFAYYRDAKIRTLLWTKRESALACIGGIIVGLSSIMIVYSIIGALLLFLLSNSEILTAFYRCIQRSMIFIILISLAVLFSLYASSYIAIMAVLSIYTISYSLNFLLFITDNATDSGVHSVLSAIALLLPRFDLLGSGWAGSSLWRRAVLSHSIYAFVCIVLCILSFSWIHSGRSSLRLTPNSNKKD